MAEETSLDVLSQAVSLVETEGLGRIDDCRDSPSKELPTKELKYRRLRERRELSSMLPLRVWNKKCSPQQTQSTGRNTGNGEECDALPVSLSPSRSGENSPTVISSPTYCKSCLLHKANGTTPPPCSHHCFHKHLTERLDQDINLTHCESDEDNDQPLDMSTKCARHEEEQSSGSSPSIQQQQQRPSVITCASALRRSQCHTKPNCQNANCNGSSSKKHHSSKSDSDDEDIRPGHRREVLSGMCDPVIDEHFRRSLGKDYPEFLSSNQTSNVSITVDDHFAKALGETWLKLQKDKPSSTESKTGSTNKITPHSPPSSPVRSHPQGVVSL